MKTGRVHAAEYGVEPVRGNVQSLGKMPGHEAVRGNNSIRRPAVQPAVHRTAAGQTAISSGPNQGETMPFFQKSPQYEGFSSVAVDDIRSEIAHESVHAVPESDQLAGRLRIERQLHGGQAERTRSFHRRRSGESGHQRLVTGLLKTMRKRYAIPRRGIVPADIDNLYRAHESPDQSLKSMEANTCASFTANESLAASLGE